MDEFDVGLLYVEDIPEDYFADFITDVSDTGSDLKVEQRENAPYAALEWVVPTAIAIYVSKPFVDAILKRAADDFGDAVYPKVKSAITRFVQRVFIHKPLPFRVVTSTENKITSAESVIFSIHAPTCDGKQLKFIFNERLNEAEYLACIDALFAQLADHHCPETNDSITAQIAELENQRTRQVFVLYSATLQQWTVADPMVKARELHAKQKANEKAS